MISIYQCAIFSPALLRRFQSTWYDTIVYCNDFYIDCITACTHVFHLESRQHTTLVKLTFRAHWWKTFSFHQFFHLFPNFIVSLTSRIAAVSRNSDETVISGAICYHYTHYTHHAFIIHITQTVHHSLSFVIILYS